MVVLETPPVGHACADAPEAFPDALADRLQGLEAVPALGGMEPDARGRAVIVALPLMGVLVLMTLSFMRWLAQDHPSSGAAETGPGVEGAAR